MKEMKKLYIRKSMWYTAYDGNWQKPQDQSNQQSYKKLAYRQTAREFI